MSDTPRSPASALPSAKVEPLRKTRPCPECGRPSERGHYPFCSDRCRNIDLNRWLSGSYAIPAAEEPDPEDGSGEGFDPQR
ncbi:DNA gyrase inhibitor YacG [Rhizobium rhizosphaerae]|uniref:DNA gyrase inhibitor YacG n=1 Tax=Xaviernesmea rhizosphaerae TaxID=1672749 RepID=A0A1Q9AIE3_9HYPH|nr:DNA gyrase inhibitor YacG [Xaviernesmea rhizosphaerae]OLP55025.1 DNA gyrase inhibitor YacG [Xaviernesmea rhizosphaerae]